MSRHPQGSGGSGLASWLATPPPDAVLEIAPGYVSAATAATRGGALAMRAYAVEPLPDGALAASLAAPNVADRLAVTAALRSVLDRVGVRSPRVALVLPDLVARVSLIHFDSLPARRDDLDQLVRWQVRKSTPFAIEDASVTYAAGRADSQGGRELVVVVARRDVIEQYEGVCADAGAQTGVVEIATFSMVNLVLASPALAASECLIVHVRPEYVSTAILRHGDLIFFRNRPEGAEESLTDVVHQTVMYHQDRLDGQRFARVLLGGHEGGGRLDQTGRALEERLGGAVERIDWTTAVAEPPSSRIGGDHHDLLAPLAGMLARVQDEAVHA